ncbi:uncharacterized protein ATNIH1004_007056 [Aspergillus tanneri]|uniref:Uncharacterized protein n=1 Tax=Aspergillus tanneri TaxID=1220188 RepID=A0A5M9MSY0_9EURO|nr:uncharacterized protein ATNIH1004_007056 [Aspergillus tanneri]KAA8645637.1 hypothetical protein ATNIH1004_007056 [Aspergillus tanneri]
MGLFPTENDGGQPVFSAQAKWTLCGSVEWTKNRRARRIRELFKEFRLQTAILCEEKAGEVAERKEHCTVAHQALQEQRLLEKAESGAEREVKRAQKQEAAKQQAERIA